MTPRILARGIAAILTLTPAFAATFTWDGGAASDDWSLAANWTPTALLRTTRRLI